MDKSRNFNFVQCLDRAEFDFEYSQCQSKASEYVEKNLKNNPPTYGDRSEERAKKNHTDGEVGERIADTFRRNTAKDINGNLLMETIPGLDERLEGLDFDNLGIVLERGPSGPDLPTTREYENLHHGYQIHVEDQLAFFGNELPDWPYYGPLEIKTKVISDGPYAHENALNPRFFFQPVKNVWEQDYWLISIDNRLDDCVFATHFIVESYLIRQYAVSERSRQNAYGSRFYVDPMRIFRRETGEIKK